MLLKFLGTGAADFDPILQTPERFQVRKSLRRCTSTLLNGHILIDCGPHVADAMGLFSVDPACIDTLLLTHTHADHFDPQVIESIATKRAHPLHIWHSEEALVPQIPNTLLHPVKIRQEFTVGECTVTVLQANHCAGAVHYSIAEDGKQMFYGTDGAWLLMDTYYYMKDRYYDLILLDATVGDYEGDYRMAEHNSIPMIRMMEKSFRTFGIANENTKILLDHMARTLHTSHEELERLAAKNGYLVAYDGMELTV